MAAPKKIVCSEQVFGLDFHPAQPLLAAGLVDGVVELWKYSVDDPNELLAKISVHPDASCRGVQFVPSAERLITISSDKSWKVMSETGAVIVATPDAHNAAINRMVLIDQDTLATGDDNGVVKIWDLRGKGLQTASWDVHSDFVSHMLFHAESGQLFSASGDATLGVYDIRQHKNFYKSDDQESEMNCLEVMRHGKKLVCGTQEGVTVFFNWGEWGDCSDRYPGQTESINCFHKFDETTLLTGSSDGVIRVVNVQPNKVLGVLGRSKGASVEHIQANHDGSFIGTLSLDDKIRFWDLSILMDESGDDEEGEGEEKEEEDAEAGEGGEEEEEKGSESEGEEEVEDEEEEEEGSSASSDDDDDDNDDEEEKDDDEDDDDDDGDGDSSSDSDDSQQPAHKKPRTLPTARQQFYADL